MKRILLIATGGTIASKPTQFGLAPLITPEELLDCVPGIAALCDVVTTRPMNLDSTNMGPDHWLQLAGCVEQAYDGFDGFVIAHGTDTMAYTASALSYLIQHSKKPIVLTGAQTSIFERDTDARTNLLDAFTYAVDTDSHGVVIVFDGKAIIGTRARKWRTKSWNAFLSVDYPELGIVRDGKILRYITEREDSAEPQWFRTLNRRVAVLKLIPGMDAGVMGYLRAQNDALVIESFGVGGIPAYGDGRFAAAIEGWLAEGKAVVMTTQVPHEGSDMSLYAVGHGLSARPGVIEAYNMTLESIVTKLMWILSGTRDIREVRERFLSPVAHDLLVPR